MKKFPPMYLWGVCLILVISGSMGIIRAWQAVVQRSLLAELGLMVSPIYLAGSGVLWSAASLIPLVGILIRRRWAAAGGMIGVVMMAASFWIDRIFFSASSITRANTVFSAGLTVLILCYFFVVFAISATRNYLSKG